MRNRDASPDHALARHLRSVRPPPVGAETTIALPENKARGTNYLKQNKDETKIDLYIRVISVS